MDICTFHVADLGHWSESAMRPANSNYSYDCLQVSWESMVATVVPRFQSAIRILFTLYAKEWLVRMASDLVAFQHRKISNFSYILKYTFHVSRHGLSTGNDAPDAPSVQSILQGNHRSAAPTAPRIQGVVYVFNGPLSGAYLYVI